MAGIVFKSVLVVFTGVPVVAASKIFTMIFILDLAERVGHFSVLVVAASGLLLFYAFFFKDFIGWFHRQTREDFTGRASKINLSQFTAALLGAAFGAMIVGLTGAVLILAEKVDAVLFWSLLGFFMVLLFFSAYKVKKTEERDRPNWWRG